MIPVELQLRGFLSYKDPVSLSFEGFDLACISGDNGAGKSSLLDAITWVLFGKARRNDDQLVNNLSTAAEVIFTFEYEGIYYRVQRMKEKGKSPILEFQIKGEDEQWKALSERTVTETQKRIQEVLHLDYETFINASFFLQGKADEFTKKNSTQRKEILAGILGMDRWEQYRDAAREYRRMVENRISTTENLLMEIETELNEEQERREAYEEAKIALQRVEEHRAEKQEMLQQAQKMADRLAQQKDLLEEYDRRVKQLTEKEEELRAQLGQRQAEQEALQQRLHASDEIETQYQSRTQLKLQLEKLDKTASQFFSLQQQLADCEKKIAVEESRVQQQILSLEKEDQRTVKLQSTLQEQTEKRERLKSEAVILSEKVKPLESLRSALDGFKKQQNLLVGENKNLLEKMNKLKDRMGRLEEEHGKSCPLCGQELSEEHRLKVIQEIQQDGKAAADQYHRNERSIEEYGQEITATSNSIQALNALEKKAQNLDRELGIMDSSLQSVVQQIRDWEDNGKRSLSSLRKTLVSKDFAQEFRTRTASLHADMQRLSYDPKQHADLRQQEEAGREIDTLHQQLLIAHNRLEPLSREVETIRGQLEQVQADLTQVGNKRNAGYANLDKLQQDAPNIDVLEGELKDLISAENQQRTIVGGALQMLEVLTQQKARQKELQKKLSGEKEELARVQILEKAFGRDGVQALLMEEALPHMEMQANETLNKLSSGSMSVRFETEREYKDKKRDDKMQVLDILINDAQGVQRPYDLFSGGEAFRINFAIRLALSKVLAQRAGARLQMLIIDEGFGTQDTEGRQKLVEAINLIRPDFKKVLVITHLDELKDAFQARIEVTKTRSGSQVEVIAQ